MKNTIDYNLSSKILHHKNDEAKEYIRNNQVDINAQDQMGFSYLHCAVTERNDDIIDFLLDAGIDINIQDEYGKTPLVLALLQYGKSNEHIVRHLIARGADMSIRTKGGRTPYELGLEVDLPEDILLMLKEAAGDRANITFQKPIDATQNMEDGDEADNILGYFSVREKYVKEKKTVKQLDSSAEADKQCDEGVAYCQKQDFANAIKCFESAAKAGSTTALGNLGLIYLKGCSVDVDEKKAFEYFKSAAELGNTLAMSQISDMYRLGIGVKKNAGKANYWKVLAEGSQKYGERKEEIKKKIDVLLTESEKMDVADVEEMCMEILDLIPDPQTMYEETAIVYYTLGITFEKNRDYQMAIQGYKHAMLVSCVKDNAMLPYRLGCCYYHMKNESQAVLYLKKAYKLGGKKLFRIDNDKYIKFAK